MLSFIESQEAVFRLLTFLIIFGVMASVEWLFPKRILTVSKAKRWLNNLALTMLNTAAVRLIFPVAAASFAVWISDQGIGLFNLVPLPLWLSVILSIVLLDGLIWFQHKLFHTIPVLWRLHAVHHADRDLDVTSGARFHPLEILLSMVIKFAAIAILGVPAVAVILFEVILSSMALFNHANVALPLSVDRWLRKVVVTPDMHRVHHSIHRYESDSNFGFNLAVWDRLFNTYRAQPKDGHDSMTIGIKSQQEEKHVVWLTGLLALPFRLFSYSPKNGQHEKPGQQSHD